MLSRLVKAGLTALLLLNSASAYPFPFDERDMLQPAITSDFPDPCILKIGDTWYAFASQSTYDYKNIKVQLATSKDFHTWTVTGTDALGSVAPWVQIEAPQVWAPSVSQRQDGTFIMYYSAITNTAGNGLLHCVGTATSHNVAGPYHSNSDKPFACPTDQGGAIDASAFRDVDGTNYALYKIDANALGHGGTCGNSIPPILPTPIMIQKVAPDGTTKLGAPVQLIHNTDREGPLVEAPYMIRTDAGVYVLFFSSNCWTTAEYDVSYATSTAGPMGRFEKTRTPLFVTGTMGMIGPGGASVAQVEGTGMVMALHGYGNMGQLGGVRWMYVTKIRPVEGEGEDGERQQQQTTKKHQQQVKIVSSSRGGGR